MENSNTIWHSSPVEEVFAELKTSPQGLAFSEVKEREQLYDANKLPPPKPHSMLILFLSQFDNVLIYILLATAIVTLLLRHWIDSSVIFSVVILNAIVGCIQEGKAEKALEAIRNMLSLMANVVRNGNRHKISAEALVPGDIVILQAGDKVPADLRLFDVKNLQIQEAIITGESQPTDKNSDPVPANAALGDRNSMAYNGTMVTYGIGKGIVIATGINTEVGRISTILRKIKPVATPLIKQMANFARWLSFAILLMAGITLSIGFFIWGHPLEQMLMAAVGIAVAAIPEGLPAILTITLAIGVTRMAKRNAIIRRLPAVETMGAVSTICTDKTGTLTYNELAVRHVITAEHTFVVSGTGYNPEGTLQLNNQTISLDSESNLKDTIRAGALCNNSELNLTNDDEWELVGNPTDGALLALGLKAKLNLDTEHQAFPQTDLIPFQSEHKFMATLHHDHEGKGYIFVKGAPEKILAMCNKQRMHNLNVTLDTDYWTNKIEELALDGERVVAVAMKTTDSEHRSLIFTDVDSDLTLLGIFGITDPPREEVIKAVTDCNRAGIQIKMITGDHAVTARAIAEQVGIKNGHGVLIGLDLDEMSDEELAKQVNEVDIYARTSPEHKLRLVQALQANDRIVAMTGDGVNDAPALRQAEIGIAMGKRGTEAAKEVAEMVLADDNFSSIRHAVEEGRAVYDNIKKAILFILPTNAAEAFSLMIAILIGRMLPITALQILWVNMITAVTLALALGFEPAEANVMRRKPRPPHEAIMSPFLIWRIIFVSLLLVTAIFGIFIYERNMGVDLATARTMVVNMLVAGEIVYLINCRKIYSSSLHAKIIFGSSAVLIAIISAIAFQLLFTYLPVMQHLFATKPLEWKQWTIIAIISVVIFIIIEIEKLFGRKINHRQ